MNYFSPRKRSSYEKISFISISVIILIVIGIVVGIYVLRFAISDTIGSGNAQTIASILNAIQIQVLNFLYPMVAKALVELENHRTSTAVSFSFLIITLY